MSDFGSLKDYIVGASVKRLSAVECDLNVSNQHELNGVRAMSRYLGAERREYSAKFIRLHDEEELAEVSTGNVTWYDAREAHPERSEFRFYYQNNPAISLSSEGDSIAVVLKKDGAVVFISAPQDSQSEYDLLTLFGNDVSWTFNILDFTQNDEELDSAKRYILQEIGVEIKADLGSDYLNMIEDRFGELTFPSTKDFSALAREQVAEIDAYDMVDDVLLAWWDTEEAMFRQLEQALIERRLESGFETVDDFLNFSQTVLQRRSSRAGRALENHLAFLFTAKGVRHAWGAITENKKRPDFLFPSTAEYGDMSFPGERLTMLGVKTTCKDRWRQVLTEANRIDHKHLLTLQPSISVNQTQEMRDVGLQLIVPLPIHRTYNETQRSWLWNLEMFMDRVISLQ